MHQLTLPSFPVESKIVGCAGAYCRIWVHSCKMLSSKMIKLEETEDVTRA
jgi:hypothetical protein